VPDSPAVQGGLIQPPEFPPSITRTPARQHSVRHRTKLLTGAQIECKMRPSIQFRLLRPRRPVPYRGGFFIRWRPAASFTAPPPTTPQERSLNAARFCFAQPIPTGTASSAARRTSSTPIPVTPATTMGAIAATWELSPGSARSARPVPKASFLSCIRAQTRCIAGLLLPWPDRARWRSRQRYDPRRRRGHRRGLPGRPAVRRSCFGNRRGAMRRSAEYQVGYGRPPQHTRFPKGQSGNPKGRPKGSRALASIWLER
jgi:hypothetical protein